MCMLENDEPIIRSYIKAQRHRGRVSVHLFRKMWAVLNKLCHGSIHCLMESSRCIAKLASAENDVAKDTVELQWLEHRWLVYHGCFELVLESLGKKIHSCRHYIWDNLV